jgi:CheY-like chemotaxis protein
MRFLRTGSFMSSTKTILVIEDNEIERQGLACLLEQDGYNVMQATDGAEAIKQVHENTPPDMMLLDMMMRGYDGWQFLRHRRRDPTLGSIPVVIVTGLDIASSEWANSLGATGLLHKPVEPEQMRNELNRALADGTAD